LFLLLFVRDMMIQIVCCVLYESLKLCDYYPFATPLISHYTIFFALLELCVLTYYIVTTNDLSPANLREY
jgi:hypothetical protein